MHAIAIRELRNNPSSLTQSLEQNEYVFITKHGKPIGAVIPLTNENLQIGLTRATALQAWRKGDISLGKMAELLSMDKTELRDILASMNLPMIDYPVEELALNQLIHHNQIRVNTPTVRSRPSTNSACARISIQDAPILT